MFNLGGEDAEVLNFRSESGGFRSYYSSMTPRPPRSKQLFLSSDLTEEIW